VNQEDLLELPWQMQGAKNEAYGTPSQEDSGFECQLDGVSVLGMKKPIAEQKRRDLFKAFLMA